MFLQASDIFQPRNSVPISLHRVSIAPGPKRRTLARNVHSLCMHPPVTPKHTTQTIRRAGGSFSFQTCLHLGNTVFKVALLGVCPSAQNQSHGQIVHKLMLFAECDCRVSLACHNGSLAAKLMHPEAYRSCHSLAERMLRCIRTTAGVRANPQRLIGIAEQPQDYAVVQPYMNSRVLRRQAEIPPGLPVVPHSHSALPRPPVPP